MTTNKITGKITGYAVKSPDMKTPAEISATADIKEILGMTPDWHRPEKLFASVYKINKCPNSPEAAVYVTISNAVLDNDAIVPVEIFINSQDVKHQQWTTALTRTISAMFRQGVDCSFIADELIQTHDPKGGFLQKGIYHPSLVSQIGRIMKAHMEGLKIAKPEGNYGASPETVTALVVEKTLKDSLQDYFEPEVVERLQKASVSADNPNDPDGNTDFPPNATLCLKCHYKAVVVSDGCSLCLNCSDSKCH
jgi:hypothetical protein